MEPSASSVTDHSPHLATKGIHSPARSYLSPELPPAHFTARPSKHVHVITLKVKPPTSYTATARTLCRCAESVVFCVPPPPPSLALDHFFSPVSLGNCTTDDSNVFWPSPQASADQALFRYFFSRDCLDVVGAEAC